MSKPVITAFDWVPWFARARVPQSHSRRSAVRTVLSAANIQRAGSDRRCPSAGSTGQQPAMGLGGCGSTNRARFEQGQLVLLNRGVRGVVEGWGCRSTWPNGWRARWGGSFWLPWAESGVVARARPASNASATRRSRHWPRANQGTQSNAVMTVCSYPCSRSGVRACGGLAAGRVLGGSRSSASLTRCRAAMGDRPSCGPNGSLHAVAVAPEHVGRGHDDTVAPAASALGDSRRRHRPRGMLQR
ncbi:hypothetical protein DMN91_012844 [Ooceraea biroi]|uniref:Uncharacterized protein n=1 Tax=Ooceraea biroi TaxID=2015173 RepID=A0A3L8D376_OOCBI|nr:hypothetical protein DMN91_012844 [Ooceraea biroi]